MQRISVALNRLVLLSTIILEVKPDVRVKIKSAEVTHSVPKLLYDSKLVV